MQLKYDDRVDAASVFVGGEIVPGGDHHKERLDADRFVRYSDIDGTVLQYEFLNVRRYGVRLDDLEHQAELSALFADAGFSERDWGHPIPTKVTRHRDRTSAAG